MKSLSFSIIYALLALSSCATLRQTETGAPVTPAVQSENKTRENLATKSVWELIGSEKVTLHLKNLDKGTNHSVFIERGISLRDVPAGDWELIGFEENGKSFKSMNTSKKYVFTMKSKKNSYGGSIVTGCPKLKSLKPLMNMKFFNRYPFSSATGLCELVVGDNLKSVQADIRKSHKNKNLNLILGF